MTEIELTNIISRRFRIKKTELDEIFSGKQFPFSLFDKIDEHDIVILMSDIFSESVLRQRTLCESEKKIVREIRKWEMTKVSPRLDRLRKCFLEEELRSSF